MNSLVQLTIDAHGGFERWRRFGHVSAHLRTGRHPLGPEAPTGRSRRCQCARRSTQRVDALAVPETQPSDISEIVVPTRRRVVGQGPDGTPTPDPLIVTIDLSEVEFA